MENKKTYAGTGIGFNTILFFIFLVLKLVGTISWSWWWVTAPLWLPLVVVLAVFVVVFLVSMIVGIITSIISSH